MQTKKIRLDGHYEIKKLGPGTDYIWVPGEEFVEEWRADDLLHPWRPEDERCRREQQTPEQQYWLEICAL